MCDVSDLVCDISDLLCDISDLLCDISDLFRESLRLKVCECQSLRV